MGQYEFPFTFRLPENLPSSFHFVNDRGENYQVRYSVAVSFDDPDPGVYENESLLHFEKEIIVMQTTDDLERFNSKKTAHFRQTGGRSNGVRNKTKKQSQQPSFLPPVH